MCNYLHKTSKRNWKRKFGDKDWGFGYKCFIQKNKHKMIYPVYKSGSFRLNEWIKWRENEEGNGFCFFLTLKDAQNYKCDSDFIIRKIRFRKSLGYHLDFCGFRIALCKEFKILNEV